MRRRTREILRKVRDPQHAAVLLHGAQGRHDARASSARSSGEYFGGASLVLGRIIVQSASSLQLRRRVGGHHRRRRSRGDRVLPRRGRSSSAWSSRGTRRVRDEAIVRPPNGCIVRRVRTGGRCPQEEIPPSGCRREEIRGRSDPVFVLAAGAALAFSACSPAASTAPSRRPRRRRRRVAPSHRRVGRRRPPRRPRRRPSALQLQWAPQAQFAGYFAADEQGYYAAEGLDVNILDGGPDVDPAGRRLRSRTAPSSRSPGCPRSSRRASRAPTSSNIAQIFQRSGTLSVSWAGRATDRRDPCRASRARRSASGTSATSSRSPRPPPTAA